MANQSTNLIGPIACSAGVLPTWVDEILEMLGAEKIPHQMFRASPKDQLVMMLEGDGGSYLLGPDARRLARHLTRLLAERSNTPTRCANVKSDSLGDQLLVDAESIQRGGHRESEAVDLPYEVVANYRQKDGASYGTRLDFTSQSGGLARFMARGMAGFHASGNWGNAPFERILGAWTAPKKLPSWPRAKALGTKASPGQKLAAAVAALETAKTEKSVIRAVARLRRAGEDPPRDPLLLSKALVASDDDARRWLLEQLERCWFTSLGPSRLATLQSRLRSCALLSEDATAERCRSLLARVSAR